MFPVPMGSFQAAFKIPKCGLGASLSNLIFTNYNIVFKTAHYETFMYSPETFQLIVNPATPVTRKITLFPDAIKALELVINAASACVTGICIIDNGRGNTVRPNATESVERRSRWGGGIKFYYRAIEKNVEGVAPSEKVKKVGRCRSNRGSCTSNLVSQYDIDFVSGSCARYTAFYYNSAIFIFSRVGAVYDKDVGGRNSVSVVCLISG